MDLDHFKSINDTYGHEAGDLILRNFASVLKKSIRQSVLLMLNTNLQQARIVAERLRSNIQNTVVLYNRQEIKFTVSGGLTIDELITKPFTKLKSWERIG